VLFQVHFLALLLEERGAGDLATVAESMSQKLIRRHPHVFGDPGTPGRIRASSDHRSPSAPSEDVPGSDSLTAGEVLKNWDAIKRDVERRTSAEEPFADIPENLPALLYARKIQRRAASAGIGELEEAEGASDPAAREATEVWLGEVLFGLVDLARRQRIDPELALRAAADRFREGAAPS
jgi:XTP/dITP diphosphohydrolase/tetrapyrrole methylase family protein/MazG family protein/ATP diphosphatase